MSLFYNINLIFIVIRQMHRLKNIQICLQKDDIKAIGGDKLTIVDNRTGKSLEINIMESKDCYYVNSKDFSKFVDKAEEPLRIYDPGYVNTICNTSRISYIDGDKGILEYRGYPIQQLAEKSTFLEVAFLLIYGQLPSSNQFFVFTDKIMTHTMLHTDVSTIMKSFRRDAYPFAMLNSTIAVLSTLKPDANPALVGQGVYKNIQHRNKQIYRLLGALPTIAANCYRHSIGREFNVPNESLGYIQNFLYMLDSNNEKNYKPHPKLTRAVQVMYILQAEHQMNCSTAFMRHITSSGVDVYTAIAMAGGALSGPKHGGAIQAVIKMFQKIGSKEKVPRFIADVKQKKALLFGFGHRVYKNYDPRAKIMKKVAFDVFQVCGTDPLIEIAMQLQRVALEDEYFISRKLYPNPDLYSGFIYRAMGFQPDMYALFSMTRVAGWIAHWVEFLGDSENNICRPRQNYVGSRRRDYIPMSERQDHKFDIDSVDLKENKRRMAAQKFKEENK